MDNPGSVRKDLDQAKEAAAHDQFARLEATLAFGPGFFLAHLGAYVRDRCPDPGEALPFVHLHLVSGEVLDVCHVIGLTPRWIALAVYEQASRAMRTELVPYETIARVTIKPGNAQGAHIGFHQDAPAPVDETAEVALQKAAVPGSNAPRRLVSPGTPER